MIFLPSHGILRCVPCQHLPWTVRMDSRKDTRLGDLLPVFHDISRFFKDFFFYRIMDLFKDSFWHFARDKYLAGMQILERERIWTNLLLLYIHTWFGMFGETLLWSQPSPIWGDMVQVDSVDAFVTVGWLINLIKQKHRRDHNMVDIQSPPALYRSQQHLDVPWICVRLVCL